MDNWGRFSLTYYDKCPFEICSRVPSPVKDALGKVVEFYEPGYVIQIDETISCLQYPDYKKFVVLVEHCGVDWV